ncbi:nucleotidyltransferase domain-containing protein [Caloramator quimbayensis]|uniref:nucleotidyltransferase domain-containing protein n=1 Tax=Caloramator quimbayensis TaxID=1147123 RepID=UPI0015C42C17|nr:nucleotidyltransferase domain-containing protein [Caloramator quimbayensis]
MYNIKEFQEAYSQVEEKLKKNSSVIAVVVYGSIIYGDIWQESDIDFLVVTKEKSKTLNIYSKAFGVPIHINYISKDMFIDSYKNILKGGTFHKAFFAGRLVYCIDDDIKNIHLSTKFYKDKDRDIRNIEILSNLLTSIHYTKKYNSVGKIETSYQWSFEVLKNYARLLMSLKGHITDKDILSLAVSMSSEINELFNYFNSEASAKDKIKSILNSAESFIEFSIEDISKPIIQYLMRKKEPCSIEDIKSCEDFKHIDGDLNMLLENLSMRKIIKESLRQYTTYGDEYLIDEIVYYIE